MMHANYVIQIPGSAWRLCWVVSLSVYNRRIHEYYDALMLLTSTAMILFRLARTLKGNIARILYKVKASGYRIWCPGTCNGYSRLKRKGIGAQNSSM